jgi:small subunit ribosomal protein S8
MMTDPIADMLTRIRNAYMASIKETTAPFSKVKFEIAKILVHENYLQSVEEIEEDKKKALKLVLKYDNKQPAITKIVRISKPGKRIYAGKNELKPVIHGYGLAVLSTPAGILTDKNARKAGVGGEILFQVW